MTSIEKIRAEWEREQAEYQSRVANDMDTLRDAERCRLAEDKLKLAEALEVAVEALRDVLGGLELFIHDPDTAPRVIDARAALAKIEQVMER